MVPAHHLLYDRCVTGHLMSSWSPHPFDYASPSMLWCIGIVLLSSFIYCTNLICSPLSLGCCLIQVSFYFIHLGQEPVQGFFVIWPYCQMLTHWLWLWAIITFISSLKMICCPSFSRWIMSWSSLDSVIRPCLSFSLVRQHNIVLQFNIACAGGFLYPSF